MSKIKEYLDFHVEKCYMHSKTKPYYISYGECMDMVYLDSEIDVTDRLIDKSSKIIIKYDKNKMAIIEI